MPSSPAVARVCPSRLNATALTKSVSPVRVPSSWWVATSTTAPSDPRSPVARVCPSGLNATEETRRPLPVKGVPICSRLATFHSCTTTPSPVAKVCPSGLKVTASTPQRVRRAPISWWVATSQNWTVPSGRPVTRILPFGLNATDETSPV